MSSLLNIGLGHPLNEFENKSVLEFELAKNICQLLSDSIATNGVAYVALSGGSTPKDLFKLLSQEELEWDKIIVTLVDERWVKSDDPLSNEKFLRENLLINNASKAKFIPMVSENFNIDDSISNYSNFLSSMPSSFDIVILGMGADGHTASWFPDCNEIDQALDPTGPNVLMTTPKSQPTQRITLGMPVILSSKNIFLHITGEEKKNVLFDIIEKDLPIHRTIKQSKKPISIYWAH